MKISFDNLRKNIAVNFNALVDDIKDLECSIGEETGLQTKIETLRRSLGILMACYDINYVPDDFNDLSEEVELLEL